MINFDSETYKDLVYEANTQDMPAPALVAHIVREYLKKQISPQQGVKHKEDNNEHNRTKTISCH